VAIAAALDAQRGLIATDFSSVEELAVRMAIHTGTVDERDGDYFGPAVNRVARLLSLAHGAETLILRCWVVFPADVRAGYNEERSPTRPGRLTRYQHR
jgi:class 3 adenylate cyclase